MKKYILEIDEKQLQTLSMASELVTRLYMGQFDVLDRVTGNVIPWEVSKQISNLLYPEGNTKGIRNEKLPDDARQLWDIYQVLRKHISEKHYTDAHDDDKPSRTGCSFDNPMKTSNECELPVLSETSNAVSYMRKMQSIGRGLRKAPPIKIIDANIADIKNNKRLIQKVHIDEADGEIQLQVICPECGRHIIIGEDDGFCPLCFREIEMMNINAWSEYEYYKDKEDKTTVDCDANRKSNKKGGFIE